MSVKNLILNKLKSKKGSALLLAMMFSLMCIILGMVVLSAGEVSNGRIVNAAKAEQSYYVASSLFREFQQEAQYIPRQEGLGPAPDPVGMQLRINTRTEDARGFGNVNYDYDNACWTRDDMHRLTTLRPFIARGLYETMVAGSYSNEIEFAIGGRNGIDEAYTARVKMTISDADYSIYLDVLDVCKVVGDNEESLGAPHLDTIAIQCRRITPKAAAVNEGTGESKLTDAVFEFDRARILH